MLPALTPPSGKYCTPRCAYGADMLLRYRTPPQGSAGKNLSSVHPSSTARSTSDGVAYNAALSARGVRRQGGGGHHAGPKGQPRLARGADDARVQPGAHTKGSARSCHRPRLLGGQDGAHAHADVRHLGHDAPHRLQPRVGAEGQLNRVDPALLHCRPSAQTPTPHGAEGDTASSALASGTACPGSCTEKPATMRAARRRSSSAGGKLGAICASAIFERQPFHGRPRSVCARRRGWRGGVLQREHVDHDAGVVR